MKQLKNIAKEIVHGRQWELVNYEWDEARGIGQFSYVSMSDPSKQVDFSRHQPTYKSNWIPRGNSNREQR